jgi:hypothetical protein
MFTMMCLVAGDADPTGLPSLGMHDAGTTQQAERTDVTALTMQHGASTHDRVGARY